MGLEQTVVMDGVGIFSIDGIYDGETYDEIAMEGGARVHISKWVNEHRAHEKLPEFDVYDGKKVRVLIMVDGEFVPPSVPAVEDASAPPTIPAVEF